MKHLLLLLLLAAMFVSCSSINVQSGKYVLLTKGENLKTVAKKYDSTVWKLREMNQGRTFSAGKWVKVPLKRGILGSGGRSPASYSPGIYDKFFSTEGFAWPVPKSQRISSDYGRRWGRNHNGIDIPAPSGTEFVAANDGVVVYSGSGYSGFGNLIIVAHRSGNFTIYGHNRKNLVDKGQYVRKGQTIGLVGNTGRSTGPHLHFEVRKNGTPMNPNRFVARK
ncbi:MAG: M23 family metallopeptidase [Bacteriovoracaceae bacterium]|nr:M23 family metallopeptidase [Bacteriovoracaceae bacterium]